jgi:peroxin-19
MLDEFATTNRDNDEQTPKASGPGRPPMAGQSSQPLDAAGGIDDDFAKQLQAGMAELMGELQSNVCMRRALVEELSANIHFQPEMQSQFESMLKELGGSLPLEEAAAAKAPSSREGLKASPSANKSAPSSAPEESFQETIKKTMERMQASGEQATAAASADDSEDFLAELMKQMQSGAGLEGEGGEEDFSKMLLGIMEQLTNKEILYEPMKELHDKFPDWIEKNKSTTSAEDMKRYLEQQKVVGEIVARFEQKAYADSNVADREYIVDRMQKVRHSIHAPIAHH